MPKVEFPYSSSGRAAANKAVGLHPEATMSGGSAGSYPKPKQPQPRKKPRRSDEVRGGNTAY